MLKYLYYQNVRLLVVGLNRLKNGKRDDKVLYQGVTATICLPGQKQRGKKSTNLESEIEVAVALCQRDLKERFSNLLDATSTDSSNKGKSTASSSFEICLSSV